MLKSLNKSKEIQMLQNKLKKLLLDIDRLTPTDMLYQTIYIYNISLI